MPTFRHGKATKVLLGDEDLSTYFNNADFGNTGDLAETTTFGATGKTYLVGLPEARATLSGFFDGSAEASDAELSAILGIEGLTVLTIGPEGLTVGRRCYSGNAREVSYELSSPVSDAVGITAEFTIEGKFESGLSLHDILAGETATANGTSFDNGAATTGGGAGSVQMVTNTRDAGSIVVKIQHSVDYSVWVDYITFASIAAGITSSERLAVTTNPMNRWLRATWTVTGGATGSYVFHVNAQRR